MASNPRYSNGNARRKLRLMVRARGDECGICHGARGPIHYDEPSDAKHPLSFVLDEKHPVRLWRQYGYASPTAAALDPNNVQAAHWICNSEKGGKDGYRIRTTITPGKLHVVAGPPCGGKTTLIKSLKADGDCVIDLDALCLALGGHDHMNVSPLWRVALAAREAAISEAARQPLTTWLIDTKPTQARVASYLRSGAVFHVCDPGMSECLKRAARDNRPEFTEPAIKKWYSTPLPGAISERVREGAADASQAADVLSGQFVATSRKR